MGRNPACTVYIGNLDQKVSKRVLYEILIQVGRVVDLYIPRDKETNRHKGFAFAEYETEGIADYAVRLFSGLVCLHNKTLKFAISGKDKSSQNSSTPVPGAIVTLPNNCPSPLSVRSYETQLSQAYAQSVINGMGSSSSYFISPVFPQASPHGVNNGLGTSNYEYNRSILGSVSNVSRPSARHPIAYPSY